MFKKLSLIISALLFATIFGFSQDLQANLKQADSLFKEQRFTQSFDLYQQLYESQAHASPAMLLKMAYIKEGLGDIPTAQYYLNEYYLATSNDLALQKMEDLAEAHGLEGYNHNDITFLFNLYYKNYNWLLIGIIGLTALVFLYVLYDRFKLQGRPISSTIFLGILLIVLFYLVNFGRDYDKALVTRSNTFVMAAPSAGSDVLDVIQKGNKLEVNGTYDVWSEVEWNGQTAYVKTRNIKPLTIW